MRARASRELGESSILSPDDAESAGPTYVLLTSKTGDDWITLQKRATETTCRRDRGNADDARDTQSR